MTENSNPSLEAFYRGRDFMAEELYNEAIDEFQESARLLSHFKPIELWGECLLRLGRVQEAIVPLAAATTLNRQPRAPTLLAEAFLAFGDKSKARSAAEIAIERHPETKRARQIIEFIDADTGI